MAWTTPGTARAGEVLTAAFWNEQVRDNLVNLRALANVVFDTEPNIVGPYTTANTWADISSNLNVSITPSATTSKILIFLVANFGGTANDTAIRLLRDSTAIAVGTGASGGVAQNVSAMARTDLSVFNIFQRTIIFVDSPSTTSATTYKAQWYINAGNIYLNRRSNDANFATHSSLFAMEIPA